ncbi:MAG: hypothetical protein AAF358_19025 [Pseudomonadota bacterium]
MKYLLTGGRQRLRGSKIKEWEGYDRGVLLELDSSNLSLKPVLEYESPPDCVPEGNRSSITFKSCSLWNDQVVAATQTEVMLISISNQSISCRVSLPGFNDVHHAFVNSAENFVVTSTGLDSVMEVDFDGHLVNEWHVLGGSTWDHFDKDTDWRKVLTTKPHMSHPNHCVEIDGELWVTRLEQRDFTNLNTGESISIPYERPHDGFVLGEDVLFTHVNGLMSRVHMPTRESSVLHDANQSHTGKESLGWCRGLWTSDMATLLVGFTRIRPTKYEESLEWMKRRLTDAASWYGSFPTRVVSIDVGSGVVNWQVDTEKLGINAIFSILPVAKA